jgi:hypothetical protein
MYSLQRAAGWNDFDLRAYLTITYKKMHWNLLDQSERQAVICLLKGLVEPQKGSDSKYNPTTGYNPMLQDNNQDKGE